MKILPSTGYKTNKTMNTTGKCLLLLAAFTASLVTEAQQAKKNPVQLGDQYFAAGEYYTAAHLYGQFLNPPKKQKPGSDFPLAQLGRRRISTTKGDSRAAILYKQAESYRLANYWQEAATAYKEYADQNPGENSEALYWYAVCERSLGHYTIAEQTIKQFLSSPNSEYKLAAEKELQTLKFIQQQLSRPDSILFKTSKVDAPNSHERGVFAPLHMGGDQYMVSSTQRDSVLVNGVNPYHSRLFTVSMNNGVMGEMTPVLIPGAATLDNQGAAAITADGKNLYFSQWKKENGKIVSSIYHSTKTENGWSSPLLVNSINTEGHNSKQPFCSADGKLYFSSDRPGGSGSFDIWYAPLNGDGTIGEAVNAGTGVNSVGEEQAPFYHNSTSTLVFSSNRLPGMGGYDLFLAKGRDNSWTAAENMGYPVNSSRDDIYFFTNDKGNLLNNALVSSDRAGSCCLETFRITKAAKNKRLMGILLDCSDNSPVEGAQVILKDATGKTWSMMTGADGKYVFEPGNESFKELSITIIKDNYIQSNAPFAAETTDESDLLMDRLTNTDVCIEKIPEPKEEEPLVIKAEDVVTVYFEFDRSILKPEVKSKLDSIYQVMIDYPTTTIQISGYTDGLGSEEYNQKLSDRRARACADYIISKGIEATRIRFVSFGACCPVEMELINGRDNPDGRSMNRRALINVKKD
jgi:outer membrane protein OmpA-like peptidoglycan-associated protein